MAQQNKNDPLIVSNTTFAIVPTWKIKGCHNIPQEYQFLSENLPSVLAFVQSLKDSSKSASVDEEMKLDDTLPDTQVKFRRNLHRIVLQIEALLQHKNLNYGNASFEPLRIFDKSGVDTKLSRLDEKLARIKASDILRKCDWADLLGYLFLEGIDQEWFDLTDLYN